MHFLLKEVALIIPWFLLIPILLIDEDFKANNLLIVINAFRPLTFHLYIICNLLCIFEVQIQTVFLNEKRRFLMKKGPGLLHKNAELIKFFNWSSRRRCFGSWKGCNYQCLLSYYVRLLQRAIYRAMVHMARLLLENHLGAIKSCFDLG